MKEKSHIRLGSPHQPRKQAAEALLDTEAGLRATCWHFDTVPSPTGTFSRNCDAES